MELNIFNINIDYNVSPSYNLVDHFFDSSTVSTYLKDRLKGKHTEYMCSLCACNRRSYLYEKVMHSWIKTGI